MVKAMVFVGESVNCGFLQVLTKGRFVAQPVKNASANAKKDNASRRYIFILINYTYHE